MALPDFSYAFNDPEYSNRVLCFVEDLPSSTRTSRASSHENLSSSAAPSSLSSSSLSMKRRRSSDAVVDGTDADGGSNVTSSSSSSGVGSRRSPSASSESGVRRATKLQKTRHSSSLSSPSNSSATNGSVSSGVVRLSSSNDGSNASSSSDDAMHTHVMASCPSWLSTSSSAPTRMLNDESTSVPSTAATSTSTSMRESSKTSSGGGAEKKEGFVTAADSDCTESTTSPTIYVYSASACAWDLSSVPPTNVSSAPCSDLLSSAAASFAATSLDPAVRGGGSRSLSGDKSARQPTPTPHSQRFSRWSDSSASADCSSSADSAERRRSEEGEFSPQKSSGESSSAPSSSSNNGVPSVDIDFDTKSKSLTEVGSGSGGGGGSLDSSDVGSGSGSGGSHGGSGGVDGGGGSGSALRLNVSKLLLSTVSDYFRRLFGDNSRFAEKGKQEVVMHVGKGESRTCEKLIRHIYANRWMTPFPWETDALELLEVLVMADRFCVTTVVVNALRALLHKTDEEFSLQICERVLGLPESITATEHFAPLRCRCISVLVQEFGTEFDRKIFSPEFLSLSPEALRLLIRSDQIVLKSENSVWVAVREWYRQACPPNGRFAAEQSLREAALPKLFEAMRLPRMDLAFLVDVVKNSSAYANTPRLRELVQDAMEFHAFDGKNGNRDWYTRHGPPEESDDTPNLGMGAAGAGGHHMFSSAMASGLHQNMLSYMPHMGLGGMSGFGGGGGMNGSMSLSVSLSSAGGSALHHANFGPQHQPTSHSNAPVSSDEKSSGGSKGSEKPSHRAHPLVPSLRDRKRYLRRAATCPSYRSEFEVKRDDLENCILSDAVLLKEIFAHGYFFRIKVERCESQELGDCMRIGLQLDTRRSGIPDDRPFQITLSFGVVVAGRTFFASPSLSRDWNDAEQLSHTTEVCRWEDVPYDSSGAFAGQIVTLCFQS